MTQNRSPTPGSVGFEMVTTARAHLSGHANLTPVVTSRTLNRTVSAEVFLKCENFQRTGSFKFRGAYNALSRLSLEQRRAGVLTYSSGNHAQAVALVGQLRGIRTTIVMPSNAPRTKRAATEGYGARVIAYDPAATTREDLAQELAAREGFTVIPPYDHPHIIAGQGTAALELVETIPDLTHLLVPCGGGGLLSGSALAAKRLQPACRVVGVEPSAADDATRSFYSGVLHTVHNPVTLADGTRTSSLGQYTFPLVLRWVDEMRAVEEAAIIEAVRFLFYRLKLVVEPSGALGLAALLGQTVPPGSRIGIVLSGGNVDGPTFTRILKESPS